MTNSFETNAVGL